MSAEKVVSLHVGKPAGFVNDPSEEAGPWVLPSQRKVGVICLILTESALFAIFVVAYVYYMGKSLNPPFPRDVIPFPVKDAVARKFRALCIELHDRLCRKNDA